MENKNHNDLTSIAIDNAILKLSKEYGVSIPKDDPILLQLFLNREVIAEIFQVVTKKLREENEKSKAFFRESLASVVKNQNEQIRILKLVAIASMVCSAICLASAAFVVLSKI